MFEDIKKQDTQVLTGDPAKAEDIFSPVEPLGARTSGLLNPAANTGPRPAINQAPGSAMTTAVGPQNPLTHLSELEGPSHGKNSRRMVRILLVFVILSVVGSAGWFAFQYFSQLKTATPSANINTADSNTNQTNNTNETTNDNENQDTSVSNSNQTVSDSIIDSDGDSLTDIQEQVLGTDPHKSDTDGDGLTDRDEVNVYKTDPINSDSDNDGLSDREEIFVWASDPHKADTDGDTYPDGEEVRNGYNPNGEGKLPPQE